MLPFYVTLRVKTQILDVNPCNVQGLLAKNKAKERLLGSYSQAELTFLSLLYPHFNSSPPPCAGVRMPAQGGHDNCVLEKTRFL
jgi:hypothetical protein